MEIDNILKEHFMLSEREIEIVIDMAARQGLTIPQLVKQALRLYQSEISPTLKHPGPLGCMGD